MTLHLRIEGTGVAGRIAVFSDPDPTHRYLLRIVWDRSLPRLCFIMLNPSTATHLVNDPTVERCCRRARAAVYGGVSILNLYAFRSTDPRGLRTAPDPVGIYNDAFLATEPRLCGRVIAGWGNHGSTGGRSKAALGVILGAGASLYALDVTKSGEPIHPLYVPYEIEEKEYAASLPCNDQPNYLSLAREIIDEVDGRMSYQAATLF